MFDLVPFCFRGNKHVGERIEGDARIEGEARLSEGELKRKSIFFQLTDPGICRRWARTRFRSQPNSARVSAL